MMRFELVRAAISAVVATSGVGTGCASPPVDSQPRFAQDQPVTCEPGGGGVTLWNAMQPYMEQARRSYPDAKSRWERGLPSGQRFFLTTRYHHSDGQVEQIFVLVARIEAGTVSGSIASDPMGPDFQAWDPYSFDEADILDWTIQHPNGVEEGNFVGKFIDTYQGECPD